MWKLNQNSMKLQKTRSNRKFFLILPLIVTDNLETTSIMPVKNSELTLFVKKLPPKANKKENERPLTATLEKPMILNIRLISKIDMSKVRKEFLNISNLCRIPLVIKNKSLHRPLSLATTEKINKKKKVSVKKTSSEPNDSWEGDESTRIKSALQERNVCRVKKLGPLRKTEAKCDTNNNNCVSGGSVIKSVRKFLIVPGAKSSSTSTNTIKCIDGVASDKSIKLSTNTETCRSCGRKDRPERFHTHNNVSSHSKQSKVMAQNEVQPTVSVKSTVKKALIIKHKPKPNSNDMKNVIPDRKPSTVTQKTAVSSTSLSHTSTTEHKTTVVPRTGSAKRTWTCYICGREFGSASLSLHEPKCLQKWERENSSLPPQLQRKPPVKPDQCFNREDWNKLAWESSQATLSICQNCGRTFYPDRLIVHQRSCKPPQSNMTSENDSTYQLNPSVMNPRPPPTYDCYICGRQFGVNSIAVHESQCLKKWKEENDTLPYDMRSTPPVKKGSGLSEPITKQLLMVSATEQEGRPTSSRKPPLFPCYICGKLFTVNSIYIHEPQCLSMWKIENEKLPTSKRRPQPIKPDIKFTPSGRVDFVGTFNRIWDNHLAELVQCKKCSRTFFPHRIETHEKSCVGLKIIQTKNK